MQKYIDFFGTRLLAILIPLSFISIMFGLVVAFVLSEIIGSIMIILGLICVFVGLLLGK